MQLFSNFQAIIHRKTNNPFGNVTCPNGNRFVTANREGVQNGCRPFSVYHTQLNLLLEPKLLLEHKDDRAWKPFFGYWFVILLKPYFPNLYRFSFPSPVYKSRLSICVWVDDAKGITWYESGKIPTLQLIHYWSAWRQRFTMFLEQKRAEVYVTLGSEAQSQSLPSTCSTIALWQAKWRL